MIYVECNPDKELVLSLGIPKRDIIHAGTKGDIFNKLDRKTDSIGLVDEDPASAQPRRLSQYKIIQNLTTIKVMKDSAKNNHVIVLCPRLEEWLVSIAKESQMNLSEFGLPDDGHHLSKVINQKLEHVKKFLSESKLKSETLNALEKLLKL